MFIPTHTVIVKRSAALQAGKYIPELKDAVESDPGFDENLRPGGNGSDEFDERKNSRQAE